MTSFWSGARRDGLGCGRLPKNSRVSKQCDWWPQVANTAHVLEAVHENESAM